MSLTPEQLAQAALIPLTGWAASHRSIPYHLIYQGVVQAIREAVAAEREACAVTAEEAQRRHDLRCPADCRCADGYHVAMAIRGRSSA